MTDNKSLEVNPFIYAEAYPNDGNDLSDYNSEEAYELGVSAGWEASRTKDLKKISYMFAIPVEDLEKALRSRDE